jgi:hypothetical protein
MAGFLSIAVSFRKANDNHDSISAAITATTKIERININNPSAERDMIFPPSSQMAQTYEPG